MIKLGEPVVVYTGTKPPAPGSFAAGDAKRKTVAAKPAGKTTDGKDRRMPRTAAAPSGDASVAKPKPKPKPKPSCGDRRAEGRHRCGGQ